LSVTKCREVAYADPETVGRAYRIGSVCPNCVCEKVSVGRYGSQGPVKSSESLHSLLVAPGDLDKDQIAITVLTHAEKKGMSVMRESASNDELRRILDQRISAKPGRHFHGVATVSCAGIRGIVTTTDTPARCRGERLYSVLDTDMHGLPNHADVFATVPSKNPHKDTKNEYKAVRARLMSIMSDNFTPAGEFRGGTILAPSSSSLAQG
jgi:hypothetical protein